jgi:hypothetical protein
MRRRERNLVRHGLIPNRATSGLAQRAYEPPAEGGESLYSYSLSCPCYLSANFCGTIRGQQSCPAASRLSRTLSRKVVPLACAPEYASSL